MTSGMRSSELKLIVAVGLMMLANGTQYVNVPWETFQWFTALSGVYAGGRQFVKRESAKAVVAPNGEQRSP